MVAPTWTAEQDAELKSLAASGCGARAAAQKLGVTRNALLGRAHRLGVSIVPAPREERPAKVKRTRRTAPRGRPALPESVRLTALAAVFAGASYSKAAMAAGCSKESISNWLKKPDLVARARLVADEAVASARAVAEQRAAEKRAAETFRAAEIELNNARILTDMPERHRAMMAARIAGETRRQVGALFGVSQERVRQIEVRYRACGLIIPGVKPLSEVAVEKFGPTEMRPSAPRRDPFAQAHAILRQASGKRAQYRITEEERARRRAWGRELGARRREVANV